MFMEATKEDCVTIARLAAKTFTDTFGHLYTQANRERHIAEKQSVAFFEQSLDAGDTLIMLKEKDALIGYAKVGHVGLPVKPPIPSGAQEIQRVYIDKAHQGKGIGKATMLHILSLPRIMTASMVYLGVWEENVKAQALYKQYGFEQVGRYLYQVGDQFDREIIMARKK